MKVENAQELGKAILRGEDFIELNPSLADKIERLLRLNRILWAVVLIELSVMTVTLIQMPATAGLSGLVSFAAGTSAAAVLGVDAAAAAVMTAVAGGGIMALKRLRNYRIRRQTDGRIFLYLR